MRIAICDDEQIFLKDMIKKLTAYQIQYNMEFDIVSFMELDQLLPQIDSFNIVFLDICFHGQNLGIEWAKQIRINGCDAIIVFCSSMKDQLQNGYGTDAVRFLIKPISEESLAESLNACFQKMETAINKLSVRTTSEQRLFINTSKILYVKSDTKQRIIYLRNGQKLATYETLKNIYDMLTKSKRTKTRFAYAQKSYIINLADVDIINYKYVTMTNGIQISIARGNYLSLRKAITDLLEENLL